MRCAGWVGRNNIDYLAALDLQTHSTPIKGALQGLSGCQTNLYLSRSFAYLAGTAKFDPPNPFNIAKLTPITFPSRLNSGPPDPPDVVAASYTILSCKTSPMCPCVFVGRERMYVSFITVLSQRCRKRVGRSRVECFQSLTSVLVGTVRHDSGGFG